ncbi:MAG TPA: HAD family hydrolase, partial [Bacillaceae bacterium]
MLKTVLFDVDGVLLSEERYFDASSLTVWEMLNSSNYMGLAPETYKTDFSDEEIASIRKEVFVSDRVLKFLKSRGLNANWDMIFLAAGYQLLRLLSQVKEREKANIERWLSQDIDREVLLDIGSVLEKYKVEVNFEDFLADFQDAEASKQGLLDHLDYLAAKKLGVTTDIFGKKGALWAVCEHISQEWYVGDKHVLNSTGRPS